MKAAGDSIFHSVFFCSRETITIVVAKRTRIDGILHLVVEGPCFFDKTEFGEFVDDVSEDSRVSIEGTGDAGENAEKAGEDGGVVSPGVSKNRPWATNSSTRAIVSANSFADLRCV